MKFTVYQTSYDREIKDEEIYKFLKYLGFCFDCKKDTKGVPFFVMKDEKTQKIDIEINSLGELIYFVKKMKGYRHKKFGDRGGLIITEEDGINYIEIYNDYRE